MARLRIKKPTASLSTGNPLLDSVLGLDEFDPSSIMGMAGPLSFGMATGSVKLSDYLSQIAKYVAENIQKGRGWTSPTPISPLFDALRHIRLPASKGKPKGELLEDALGIADYTKLPDVFSKEYPSLSTVLEGMEQRGYGTPRYLVKKGSMQQDFSRLFELLRDLSKVSGN